VLYVYPSCATGHVVGALLTRPSCITGLTAIGNESARVADANRSADTMMSAGNSPRRVHDFAIFQDVLTIPRDSDQWRKARANVFSRLDVERSFACAREPRFIMPKYGDPGLKHANHSVAHPGIDCVACGDGSNGKIEMENRCRMNCELHAPRLL
jgi:hypothetical protein